MNNSSRTPHFFANWVLLAIVSPAPGGIVVLAGGGGVGAYDSDGNVTDRVSWNQPGPHTLAAQWRELYASGTFHIAADDETLSLSFDAAHSVRRTSQKSRAEMYSTAGGGFWFMSDLDVLVSVSGGMTYSLHGQEDPGAWMFIQIANQNQDLIHQKSASSNYGPPDGTITLADSILLHGGSQYFLNVGSGVAQIAVGIPELPSTASSEMTLTIHAIPEPVTILLLAIGSLVGLNIRVLHR